MFFFDGIVDWWASLPLWVRYGVAIIILGISALALLNGRLILWGWGLGVAFLFLAGRSDSEKRGYNF
ncbi:MAG: hypothetical protein KF691_08485 [Phycisphaeraceae bacterium]|nr:hypothetical protein [Phycisphaeraceae bacterium]